MLGVPVVGRNRVGYSHICEQLSSCLDACTKEKRTGSTPVCLEYSYNGSTLLLPKCSPAGYHVDGKNASRHSTERFKGDDLLDGHDHDSRRRAILYWTL